MPLWTLKNGALPLFKSVGLVPKLSKTIARSQIWCASCEICSYHLGLESPDLSPPFKDLNQNEKESRIHFQKREIVEVSWNPTWEPEVLQNACESFRQSLNKFEEHIAAPNLSQPAPDEHLNDLQKQGFSAIQEGNKYQPYNVDLRNKVSFDT